MPIKINGATSGSTTIAAPDTGSDETIVLSTALASKADISTNGAWLTDWTATFTQSGALTTSQATSRYIVIGNICHAWVQVVFSNAGTGNNSLLLSSLPVNAVAGNARTIGSGLLFDSSTSTGYSGLMLWVSNTQIRFIGDWSGVNEWGVTPNLAIASSDSWRIQLTYETA